MQVMQALVGCQKRWTNRLTRCFHSFDIIQLHRCVGGDDPPLGPMLQFCLRSVSRPSVGDLAWDGGTLLWNVEPDAAASALTGLKSSREQRSRVFVARWREHDAQIQSQMARTSGIDVMYRIRRTGAATAVTRSRWAVSALLGGIGCFALVMGLMVYLADRDPGGVLLLPTTAALGTGPIFGVLGAWLPSFVHPFAFSLFTAAALPRSAAPAYGACVAWWAVNLAFEAAQHAQISGWLAGSLLSVFGHSGLTRTLSDYFLLGTFDVGDIVAATAGALAAAGVLELMHQRETGHAH